MFKQQNVAILFSVGLFLLTTGCPSNSDPIVVPNDDSAVEQQAEVDDVSASYAEDFDEPGN